MPIHVTRDCQTTLSWLLNHQGSFRLDNYYWSSLAKYLEVMQYHGIAEDQFYAIYCAYGSDKYQALLDEHQIRPNPNWMAVRDRRARDALMAKFGADFSARAILLSTADESLIVNDPDPYWDEQLSGEPSNRLGTFLIDVRNEISERANNAELIQCHHGKHKENEEFRQVCVHVLDGYAEHHFFEWNDTNDPSRERLWCENCAKDLKLSQCHLRTICRGTFNELRNKEPGPAGVVGIKAVKIQPSSLQFESSIVWKPFQSGTTPLAITPWEADDTTSFLVLDDNGFLALVDANIRQITDVCRVDISSLQAEKDDDGEPLTITMKLSRNGRLAAICNEKGQYGAAYDLWNSRLTMRLDRGSYHVEHCKYPVAFMEHAEQTLLVHATDWNRLDISDPLTGELLTKRESPKYGDDRQRHEHYLDYFHCQLHVSPDSQWIADTGWVWHPLGVVRLWSLHEWLSNCWESEDGASVKDIAQTGYHWDGSACWVDNKTFAVWGYGDDDDNMLDAVELYNATTGKLIDWFAGPSGDFFFDQYLISSGEKAGTQVWDISAGSQLLHHPDLIVHHYHRRSKSFLRVTKDGEWSVHRLNSESLHNSPPKQEST